MKAFNKPMLGIGILVCAAICFADRPALAQSPPPLGGHFALHNYVTGYCLAVASDNTSPGAQIITWPCNGKVSQQWYQGDPTAKGSLGGFQAYTLDSMVLNCPSCAPLVAGAQGGFVGDGTPVITWTEDPTNYGQVEAADNQGWAMEYHTNDRNNHACYQLLNAGSERQTAYNMGVLGANTSPGAQVVTWQDVNSNGFPNGPTADQLWCVYYDPYDCAHCNDGSCQCGYLNPNGLCSGHGGNDPTIGCTRQ